MAEQLKLFEDILPLNEPKEKRDLTEKRMLEKKEKPYYVTNLATGTLEHVNNHKDDWYPKDKKKKRPRTGVCSARDTRGPATHRLSVHSR